MKAAIVLLVLFLLPCVDAFPCRHFNPVEWLACVAIEKSGLEQNEKDLLESTMLYSGSIPNHEIIREWNLDIEPTRPRYEISAVNNGYIKNAWMSIIGTYPSVEYNNETLVPEKGELQTAYHYEIEYPKRKGCSNKYSTIDKDEKLSLYADDRYLGDKKLQKYSLDDNARLKAQLDIEIKTEVKHYRNNKGKCTSTGSDIVTSKVRLSDYLKVKLDSSKPKIDFKVIDCYAATIRAQASGADYSALTFQTPDTEASHYLFHYSLGWKLKPYYVIYLKADKQEHYETKNIVVNNDNRTINYYLPEQKKCEILAYNHFAQFNIPCSLKVPYNALKLRTDKLKYKEDEPIKVDTSPKNTPVKVTYCNQQKISEGSVTFPASEQCNIVEAEHEGIKLSRGIEVINNKSWSLLWKICLVILLVFFLYKIISKYLGGMIQ